MCGLKCKLIFLLSFFHPWVVNAQEIGSKKINQIKFSPIRIVDLVNPGYEFSYERITAKHYTSQISLAYMVNVSGVSTYNEFKGYRIALEEKYFLRSKKRPNTYYSIETVFLNLKYGTAALYKKDTALLSPTYIDNYNIDKKTLSINIKNGFQFFYKRIVLDFSAGIGIKYRKIKWSNIDDLNAYKILPRHINAYEIANEEGASITINVPVNLKVGYTF